MSLLDILGMPVTEAFGKLYRGKAAERVADFAPADSTRRLEIGAREDLLPDQHYLTVKARKTVLAYDRVLLETFYAVAHSTIVLVDGEGAPRTFTSFHTLNPDLLSLDRKAGDKLVQGERTLLDCVPFRGGAIDATIALLGIEAANYATPLLSTLQKLSDIAGVSYIAAAAAIAEPLILGIQGLSQAGGGVQLAYAGNLPPKTGVFLVAGIDRPGFDWSEYSFASDYTLMRKGVPVAGTSYMAITMELSTRRPTFLQIPELRAAEAALDEAVTRARRKILDPGSPERKDVEDALANLQWQCLNTLDLCSEDRLRIARQSKDKILSYMQMTDGGLGGPRADSAARGAPADAAIDYDNLHFSLADLPAFPRPES